MSRVRSLLVPLAAAWLSVYLLGTTGTAAVAFVSGGSTPDIVCTCDHGADHGSCPMHRTTTDAARCRVQAVQDELSSALLSLLGPLLLPAATHVLTLGGPSPTPIGYVSPQPSDWIVPPDPPPPRS